MNDAPSIEALFSDPCVRVYEYSHADMPRVGERHRLYPLATKQPWTAPWGTVVRVMEGGDHCGVDVYVRFPDRKALEKAERKHGFQKDIAP